MGGTIDRTFKSEASNKERGGEQGHHGEKNSWLAVDEKGRRHAKFERGKAGLALARTQLECSGGRGGLWGVEWSEGER